MWKHESEVARYHGITWPKAFLLVCLRKMQKDELEVKYKGKAYTVKQSDLHREPLAKLQALSFDCFVKWLAGKDLDTLQSTDPKLPRAPKSCQKGWIPIVNFIYTWWIWWTCASFSMDAG